MNGFGRTAQGIPELLQNQVPGRSVQSQIKDLAPIWAIDAQSLGGLSDVTPFTTHQGQAKKWLMIGQGRYGRCRAYFLRLQFLLGAKHLSFGGLSSPIALAQGLHKAPLGDVKRQVHAGQAPITVVNRGCSWARVEIQEDRVGAQALSLGVPVKGFGAHAAHQAPTQITNDVKLVCPLPISDTSTQAVVQLLGSPGSIHPIREAPSVDHLHATHSARFNDATHLQNWPVVTVRMPHHQQPIHLPCRLHHLQSFTQLAGHGFFHQDMTTHRKRRLHMLQVQIGGGGHIDQIQGFLMGQHLAKACISFGGQGGAARVGVLFTKLRIRLGKGHPRKTGVLGECGQKSLGRRAQTHNAHRQGP